MACVGCEGKPAPENNPCAVCGLTAPSNANTSGLEVVAWRFVNCIGGWTFHSRPIPGIASAEALVTAASAQARIAELEALVESYRRTADLEARDGDAAEARADRLAKALERIAEHLCAVEPHKSETAVQWAENEARAALQQETQP